MEVCSIISILRFYLQVPWYNIPYYKIMAPVVFNIENMNRRSLGKYQTRLDEFDIFQATVDLMRFIFSILYLRTHTTGDMNFFLYCLPLKHHREPPSILFASRFVDITFTN